MMFSEKTYYKKNKHIDSQKKKIKHKVDRYHRFFHTSKYILAKGQSEGSQR